MPRIQWIDETKAQGDPAHGELAAAYRDWFAHNPKRQQIPDILRCFSQRPDFLRDVFSFSYGLHFSPGHLDRRTKEMIATYVSGLNKCKY